MKLRRTSLAGVAELADARDSKSRDLHWSCGFDPHLQHQFLILIITTTEALDLRVFARIGTRVFAPIDK